MRQNYRKEIKVAELYFKQVSRRIIYMFAMQSIRFNKDVQSGNIE